MAKEIPILFSTPMVQAIMEGRKTQTRRIVKIEDVQANPNEFRYVGNSTTKEIARPAIKYDDRIWHEFGLRRNNAPAWVIPAPWKVGDLLWVRETWGWGPTGKGQILVYKASHEGPMHNRWRPSIHLPKIAARIWLQVESVGVERLQEISEEDAKAEGVKPAHCDSNEGCPSALCVDGCQAKGEYYDYEDTERCEGQPCYSAVESFESLWRSINGPGSWEANPFVWVVKFRVVSVTGREPLVNKNNTTP